MRYRYFIIGAGKQGAAAAYDLSKFGDAEHILFADMDLDVAKKARDRINKLIVRDVAISTQANALASSGLASLMDGFDVAKACFDVRWE